ncbi:MaoC family dehydratase [Thermopetrobacter sp. TC1]|uniref:MaoC family dehydratase n=1 Tax=Thermopetrobacter sp. TC1 TaxID=1495045 RepID=UPI00056EBF11|nr:MaoC family dehydratase [Thermopetrobacter sp. TC1]
MSETAGNFFEDFSLGQVIRHATPRTLSEGERALYTALYGPRFAVQSSDAFARGLGYPAAPLDDLIVFHTVLGKTVPDISRNAIANLGYAEGRFLKPVYPGTSLTATSEVIGLKPTSNRKAGIVWVRTRGYDEEGDCVLEYARWVMVARKIPLPEDAPLEEATVPTLAEAVSPEGLGAGLPEDFDLSAWDDALSGSARRWEDYEVGECIDHVDGMTVQEAEHMMATRLWQNTARVHFDALLQKDSRFGRPLVYGGHVISIARALSFNGLANAFHIAAINGGVHAAPVFAGDTIYAWSEIIDKAQLPERNDVGALRIITWAVKNRTAADFPGHAQEGKDYEDGVVLKFDYWALMPRRG